MCGVFGKFLPFLSHSFPAHCPAQQVSSNPAQLQELASTLCVSYDEARAEVTAHFETLTRQTETIIKNQDRGCSRLIANLTARSLWREYCGPANEEVPAWPGT